MVESYWYYSIVSIGMLRIDYMSDILYISDFNEMSI